MVSELQALVENFSKKLRKFSVWRPTVLIDFMDEKHVRFLVCCVDCETMLHYKLEGKNWILENIKKTRNICEFCRQQKS